MPGFGFHIKGDGLYAFASDGMDTTEVKVSADLTPPWDYSWILEAILFPNSHVQFKVNEIFVTSIYAYIPTGYDTLFNLLCYSAGQGGAFAHLLQAGNGLFFQDT